MAEFYVEGSQGWLACDNVTGKVIHMYDNIEGNSDYVNIERIDLEGEYFKEGQTVDILWVGYWLKNGTYEPAIVEEV